MKLEIGTVVRWESAAGVLTGTIKNITLSPSASGAITPWIDIERKVYYKLSGTYLNHTTRLCALDGYLKGMRVTVVAKKQQSEMA